MPHTMICIPKCPGLLSAKSACRRVLGPSHACLAWCVESGGQNSPGTQHPDQIRYYGVSRLNGERQIGPLSKCVLEAGRDWSPAPCALAHWPVTATAFPLTGFD